MIFFVLCSIAAAIPILLDSIRIVGITKCRTAMEIFGDMKLEVVYVVQAPRHLLCFFSNRLNFFVESDSLILKQKNETSITF